MLDSGEDRGIDSPLQLALNEKVLLFNSSLGVMEVAE
jgi:hypothetical protein